MRRAFKITFWVVASVLGLVVVLIATALLWLTSGRLTPIVNAYATEYLNATVSFKTVDLSLFADFPRVSVTLVGGQVISHALNGQDTLLRFDNFAVSLDALRLIGGRVSVNSVKLVRPWISGVVDSAGRASWNVIKQSSDSSSFDLNLDIGRMSIEGEAVVELFDYRDSTHLHACFDRWAASGHLTNEIKHFRVDMLEMVGAHGSISSRRDTVNGSFELDTLSVIRHGGLYATNVAMRGGTLRVGRDTVMRPVPLHIAGGVGFFKDTLTVDELSIDVGGILSTINGRAVIGDSTINSALTLTLPNIGLKQAFKLIPSIPYSKIDRMRSSIALKIEAKIDGVYNLKNGSLPRISLSINAPEGYMSIEGQSQRLDKFALSSTLLLDGASTSFTINELELAGAGVTLSARCHAKDLMGDPYIDATASGHVDVDTLMSLFPTTDQLSAHGSVTLSAGGKFRLSQPGIRSLANTTLWANIELHKLDIALPTKQLNIYASGELKLGTDANKHDTIIDRAVRVVGLYASLDTVHVALSDQMLISGKKITLWANTAAARYADTQQKVIHPFNGTLSATRLQIMAADSSLIRLRKVNCNFNVTPLATDPTIPLLRATVTAGSVSARSDLNLYMLTGMKFGLTAQVIPRPQPPRTRRRAVRVVDEMTSGDIDMKVGGDFLQILRHWNAQGQLQASRVRVITPYLPLRTEIRRLDLQFNTNQIDLRSLELKAGHSSINVDGSVSNLRRVLAGRGTLKAQLTLLADTIDFTQLIGAINAGSASIDHISQRIDSLGGANEENQEQIAKIIAQSGAETTPSNLIIIPKNIDLDLILAARYARYGAMVMDSLHAELSSQNRVLRIKDLTASSNIGQMNFSAIYSTISKRELTTGFDIELQGVKVAELIDLMPAVDSLLPMLASFEGELDCKFAARASLDTAMNIIIPTLNAAGSIKGHNLVLLDGQTFTEISKIMRFKNRKRNIIDSISVQMLIKNSAIEIFPFILEIDRYKTAISGVQNLDMSFNYHISVLKSVVPFRLGVDIFGNLDNWDFKLVKAKYKNEHIPSYVEQIDSLRLNIQSL